MNDHVQALLCKALNQRAYAAHCQDPARRRRYLATAMIAEELANYINDRDRLPDTFWQRLQERREIKDPHLKLVSSR